MKKTILLSIFVLSVLVFGGCEGGEVDKKDIEGSPEEQQDEGMLDETQDKETEGPSFQDFAEMRKEMSYKGTYEMTSTMTDSVPEEVSMYFAYPEKRIDGVTTIGGEKKETRFYIDEDKYTTCSKQQGSWMCFSLSKDKFIDKSSGAGMTTRKISAAETNPEDYELNYVGSKNFAGKSSECYEVIPADESWESEACYTSDGMIAYAEMENEEGTSTMEAIELSKEVSEGDFEAPAEPKDMSGMIPEGIQP